MTSRWKGRIAAAATIIVLAACSNSEPEQGAVTASPQPPGAVATAAAPDNPCLTKSELEQQLPAIHSESSPGDADYEQVSVVGDLVCDDGWLFARISVDAGFAQLEGMAVLEWVDDHWVDYGGAATELPEGLCDRAPAAIRQELGHC